MKQPFFYYLAFSLLCVAKSAYASATFFYITPDNLDQGFYEFKVSIKPSEGNITFNVVATAKNPSQSNSKIGAAISHVDVTGNEQSISVVRSTPIQKSDSTYQTTFSLSSEELNTPNLRFVFSETDTDMPIVSFYIFHLLDFLPKEAQQDAAANP